MAALDVTLSVFSSTHRSPFNSKSLSLSSKLAPPFSVNFAISNSAPVLSYNVPLFLNNNSNNNPTSKRLCLFEPCCSSAVEDATVEQQEEKTEETQEPNQKRKLYVVNLPWSLTAVDIKSLFRECGTVTDVEVIKQKNGKSRGFAFVTMENAEDAQSAIDKFNSQEVSGRTIRVEFAKRFKRPTPPPPDTVPGETRHKLYVSNLAWKVRSSHLREFFSANFNPISSRVLFDGSTGKAAGYGFVSFATRDEAEAAMSALNGKELMGRQLHLKFSERKVDEPESENEEQNNTESQPDES